MAGQYWIEREGVSDSAHVLAKRPRVACQEGSNKSWRLTPREEQILRMRFGIDEKTDYTLEEVGQRFAVTRERIRQIEAKALRKLRNPSRAKSLEAFIDA